MALVAWSPRRVRSPGRTAEGPGWSLQACVNSRRHAGKIGIRQSATDGEHRTAGAPGGRSYALGDSREPRYHLVGVHMVDVAGLRLIECLDSALARERPWLPPGGKADSQRLTDEKRRNLAKRNAETIVRQMHINRNRLPIPTSQLCCTIWNCGVVCHRQCLRPLCGSESQGQKNPRGDCPGERRVPLFRGRCAGAIDAPSRGRK